MPHAILAHAGLSIWLDVGLGFAMAALMLVTAELLARRAEDRAVRMRTLVRDGSAPALAADIATA